MTGDEIGAMRRAIALSALGLGSTSPNPPVGCVILDAAGRPVSEGFHRRKGEAHAEVHALAAAGNRAAGGTAIVTLEPCNHHGRTPPCHQALIDAGIARVLIAVIDPTSRGAGGAARLREAGIQVQVGLLADEALVVLGPWLHSLSTGRPKVVWACDGASGHLRQASDEVVEQAGLRYQTDAIVRTDGKVEEGVAGTHGRGAFELPTYVSLADPLAALTSLYDSGARTILLHGGAELAERFAERHLVDEIRMFIDSSTSPDAAPGFTVLDGFVIQAVTRFSLGVLVDMILIHDNASA